MSKKRFYMSTVAGFAAFLAAGSVSAATISAYLNNPIGGGLPHLPTYDPTFGQPGYSGSMSSLTDISAGNYPAGLQFAKFNTSLGSLSSISIQLYIDYKSVLNIVNSSLVTSTGDAATRITAKATFASGAIAQSGYVMPAFTYALAAGATLGATLFSTGDANLNGGDGGPISLLKNLSNVTDKAAYSALGSNNFDLTGTGFSGITFRTLTDTVVANTGGATSATQITNLDVDGIITYTYTAAPVGPPPPVGVPEPMTAAVLMAGLAGLAGIRRRR